MIKIDLSLEPHLIVAMLELIQATVEVFMGRPIVETSTPENDPELREAWESELSESLRADFKFLIEVLQSNRFGDGALEIEEEVAEGVLRASSAIRLKLREAVLDNVSSKDLEDGLVDILELPHDQQRCYACYLFLAHLQSLILYAIDPSCEEL